MAIQKSTKKSVRMAREKFIQVVARRRRVSARVRLIKGKGESTVNSKPIDVYFPGPVSKEIWMKPLNLTEAADKYYITVKVAGGGKKGQLDAVAHGIAKALVKADPEKYKKTVKDVGLLARDARIRQRRMVGMGGKSRRKKQSPKR